MAKKTASKAPRKKRLAEILKGARPKKRKSWFDRAFPAGKERAELLEVRKEFRAGAYSHLSVRHFRDLVNEQIKLGVEYQAFEKWLLNEEE